MWLSLCCKFVISFLTAFCGGAAGMILTGYLGTNKFKAVLLLTLTVGISGLALAGVVINHIDVAPKFASILMGISNTISNISGFVVPQLAKALTPNVRPRVVCEQIVQCIHNEPFYSK